MDEAEVSYASVVFKSNKTPTSKAKTEEETLYAEVKGRDKSSKGNSPSNCKEDDEVVYDEVKGKHKPSEQTAVSAGYLQDSDMKAEKNRRPHCQCVACCLGILCLILLSAIIAMSVYIGLRQENVNELKQLQENQTNLLSLQEKLNNQNKQLNSEIKKLNDTCNNLQVQKDQLTQANSEIKRQVTNLTELNQELESQRNNLTQQIRNMETKWNKDNVTRAQWSIDAYCPKENNRRTCKTCQKDWNNVQTSCYVINNAKGSEQKTWEEARINCRGKGSDLAVIVSEAEKTFTTDNSWNEAGISGYWIGLKAEGGRWKWVDGSELTNNLWIESPVDGRCATSLQGTGWKSVNCTQRNAWICGKKALTV